MLLYLPRNLAGLAGLASRDSGRFATNAVRVEDAGNGLYRCESTDGRCLAIIQGPIPEESYNRLDGDLQPGDVLLSREDWVQAFKLGDRKRPIGLAVEGAELTLAVGDQAFLTRPAEGHFPDTDRVLPAHGPLLSLCVNPAILARVLDLAAGLEPEAGVSLLFYGKDKPLGVTARNDAGQAFDALVVPLSKV
jgi:DNA polymerase III sliding clamp (beta) subunit (PCNA family)